MAVDTAVKRASLIGYGMPFRLALPFPDGTIEQADRQHLAGLYSGIAADDPVTVLTPYITITGHRTTISVTGRRTAITVTGHRTGET